MGEEREGVRQTIRDKYKIEKKENTDDEEDEDEDDEDFPGGKKDQPMSDDPAKQARKMAEEQLNRAKQMAGEKCSIQENKKRKKKNPTNISRATYRRKKPIVSVQHCSLAVRSMQHNIISISLYTI